MAVIFASSTSQLYMTVLKYTSRSFYQLVEQAALSKIRLFERLVRTGDVDADLAGGVAAQHGAGMNEGGFNALPRSGYGGAQTRHAAADHNDFVFFFCVSDIHKP